MFALNKNARINGQQWGSPDLFIAARNRGLFFFAAQPRQSLEISRSRHELENVLLKL